VRTMRPRQDPPTTAGRIFAKADTSSFLILFILLLSVLPARRVLPPLGAEGRPSTMLGVGLLIAWVLAHVNRRVAPLGRNPVRSAILMMWSALLLSYVAGIGRGIGGIEQSAADRSLIAMASFTGVALIATDGISTRERLDSVVEWLVYGMGFISLVGFLQFVAGIDLAPNISIPPLVLNSDLIPTRLRGDALRVPGTAGHPIEFGVLGAMILPLAVHLLMKSATRNQRVIRSVLLVLIATSIPFSGARAAWLGLIGAMLVLSRIWNWRVRLNAAVISVFGLGALYASSPGALTTMRYLILHFGADPSVQGRTDDYSVVFRQFGERPWLGRGYGTYVPELYRVLDNQLLMLLVSAGIIGTIAVIHVFTSSWRSLTVVAEESESKETRHLAYALKSALLAGLVTSLTFDSFSFVTFAGAVFLIIGMSGALLRLHVGKSELLPTGPRSNAFAGVVRGGSLLSAWVPRRHGSDLV